MKKQLFYILILCMYPLLDATQLIQGNVAPTVAENGCPTNVTTTFNQPINAVTYDPLHGIFWVALASGAEKYAISAFSRIIDSGQVPRFQPYATNALVTNMAINMLTTVPSTTNSYATGVITGNENVFLLNQQNNITESDTLKLFNATSNTDGADADAINAIAANNNFIFAAVSDGAFGSTDSGIAVININKTTQALDQTAAVPGDSGIKAQELDDLSPEIRIGGGITPRHPNIMSNPQLVWDEQLQRLYIGVSLASDTTTQQANDGMRSIVVGQALGYPESGTLPLFNIAPDAAFNNNQNNLVGVTLTMNGQSLALTVQKLATMHVSAGPSYLVVNGGNGTDTNQIFALPLVDVGDPSNNTQGTLANKNMFNATTHHFEVAATANADLTTSSDTFALVGAGPIPIEPTQTISDMQIIGDAVYISLQLPQSDTNETGILYSQALFDETGQIESWTPWTKRAWPIGGFPDGPSNSQVSFFAVDAVTGKIIAVDSTKQTVRTTQWYQADTINDPCPTDCSLASVISRSLCNGAYSVLDLDQSTQGIGQTIAYRYALFGGVNKVDIALISTSRASSAPFDINAITNIPYPQQVTTDFCVSENFATTTLPAPGGCVSSLAYSYRTQAQTNTNYFFAGTQHGLFVFAQEDGTGFNVTDLGLLNTGIIAQGAWQAIATITDPVIDIACEGNALYVLTSSTSCQTPLASKVLLIPFATTISAMFAPSNIYTIAQSGATSTSPALQQTLIFTAIDLIQTNAAGTQEQLVVATNNGIFQSQAVAGVQAVTTEAAANWIAIQTNTLFYGIGSIDNATIKSTDWPFSAEDACGFGTFEGSSIHQLNGTNNSDPFQFIPAFFNYNSLSTDSCCSQTDQFFEKIDYFWSDGGRRFFIVSPINCNIGGIPCCAKKSCCCPREQLRFLQVSPFDTLSWNIHNLTQTIIRECALSNISAYYWVRHIGMSGIILAGTQSGVVALQ